MFWHLRMILAWQKKLGKFTKVLGIEKTPHPFGKNSQKILHLFYLAPKKVMRLIHAELNTVLSEFKPFKGAKLSCDDSKVKISSFSFTP